MAIRTLRFVGAVSHNRYPLSRLLSSEQIPQLSEQFVLHQLSELLLINPNPKPVQFTQPPLQESQITTSPPTQNLLSPAEKLRGVFLQNLKGKSAVVSALSATGVDLDAKTFHDVVSKGSLGGEPMVSFFDWAIEQENLDKSLETYNVVLKALGRRKFFPFMGDILIRMKNHGVNPDLETLEIVIDSFVRARRVVRAVELFRRLEEIGISCSNRDSFLVTLRCLCRRSHVSTASSLFNSMRGKIPFDNVTYNEVICGWARLGRVDKVERYFKLMRDDGLSPDHLSFTHLLEAFGRAGRIGDAVRVFEKMAEMGCVPSTLTYNVMISNYISLGDLENSMKLFKGMSEKFCLPDIETYNKLVRALLKVRRVADALELFDEMLERGTYPSMGMITSFLEPLCNFGPPHAAMLIYNKSRKVGCILSMKAYKLLLMRLSRFGKCGMVLGIWEDMQESGYASDKEVYEYIVNGLCNIGQVDNAVLVVEEALRKGFCLGKVVYSKLNTKLMEMNKVEMAYKLFLKVRGARDDANARRFWRANGWHY